MGSPPASASKETWRATFRAYRRSLSDSEYATRSGLIVQRALSAAAVVQAQVVHVYWPLPAQREVDTRRLIAALRALGRNVVLPVVSAFPPAAPALTHRRYRGPRRLTPNRWNIPEPTDTEAVPPEALDAVLVPALGADRRGHRIGHGSGYYDAFLQDVSCPRVGLVYGRCVVPTLPAAPHDIPMTALVTEQAVIDV